MLATGGSLEPTCRVINEGLNDNALIVPGLGDAGARQFGEP